MNQFLSLVLEAVEYNAAFAKGLAFLAAGIAMGIAALGPALGQGFAAGKCFRQPVTSVIFPCSTFTVK